MFTKPVIRILLWLVVIAILAAGLSLPQHGLAYPPETSLQTIGLLCGKLTFMTDAKTGASLLGLKGCNNEVYIFSQHPAELFNYYEIRNAKIESGEKIETTKHGYITKYIKSWGSYYEISSCNECGKGSSVTATQPPTVATEPPSGNVPPLYGKMMTLTIRSGGMTATWAPVFFPCGSASAHSLQGTLGTSVTDGYYAIQGAEIGPGSGQMTDYGAIEKSILRWSDITPIASCEAVGMPDVALQHVFTISIHKMSWQPEPQAFKPTTLVLDTVVKGLPAEGSGYLLELEVREDFPYDSLKFAFEGDTCSRCSPSTLQEGEFALSVEGWMFPATYQGTVDVTLISTSHPDVKTRAFDIWRVNASDQSYYHCGGLIIKAIYQKMGEMIKTQGVGSAADMQLKLSEDMLDTTRRLELCGENQACRDAILNDNTERIVMMAVEAGASLTPKGALLVTIKKLVEMGVEGFKCADWLRSYVVVFIKDNILKGGLLNAVFSQSPVYPLVVNASGQRAGWLESGEIVTEIPGSEVTELDSQRLVLWEGTEAVTISTAAYEVGELQLSVVVARGAGDGESLFYPGVLVMHGARTRLDLGKTNPSLEVDLNGDGRTDETRPAQQEMIGQPPAGGIVPPQVATDVPLRSILYGAAAGLGVFFVLLLVAGVVFLLWRRARRT